MLFHKLKYPALSLFDIACYISIKMPCLLTIYEILKLQRIIELRLEHTTDNYLMSKVARDSHRFLEAIIETAIFLDKCEMDDHFWENQEAIEKAAIKCSELAGRKDYLDYYRTLLESDQLLIKP